MLARITSLRVEFLVALLLAVFAVVEMIGAIELPMGEEFTIGPGAMPLIYSVGLLLFAGYLLYTSRPKRSVAEANPLKEAEEEAPKLDYGAGVKTFLLVTGLIAAIYFVGFLVSMMVFAVLHLRLVMRMPWLKAATIGVIWGGALYFAFAHLLEVQLEPGILFSGS